MSKRGLLGVALALLVFAGQAMASTIGGDVYAPATSTVNVGSATVRAVAGGGGVLQNHFREMRNEMRTASVSQFGSNDAVASPYYGGGWDFANRIWASAIHTNIDADNQKGQIGSGYKYKAWGGAFGFDHSFGNVVAGAAFTYSRGDYDAKGVNDDVTIDNFGVSAYATYYNPCNGFFADIFGGYNYGDNKMKLYNGATWDTASPHTNSYWVGGNVGYDVRLSDNFTLTPSVGLLWMHSKSSNYLLGNTRYDRMKQSSLLLPIDLAATYTHRLDDCSTVEVTVKGGYSYDFKNDGGRGIYNINNAGPTALRGVDPGRHNWNVGAGFRYTRGKFDIGAEYRYDGRKKYSSHTVSATVGVSF